MLTNCSFSTCSIHSHLPVGARYSKVSKSPPFSSLYLFLYICLLMIWTNDVYFFLLQVSKSLLNFILVLELFSTWPMGAPKAGFYSLLTCVHHFFLKYSLPSLTARGPRLFGRYLSQAANLGSLYQALVLFF